MSDLIPIVYYGGLMTLFFFWIYGIVSFALDVKHKIVPGIRQYHRGKRAQTKRQNHDNDRQEREEQLY